MVSSLRMRKPRLSVREFTRLPCEVAGHGSIPGLMDRAFSSPLREKFQEERRGTPSLRCEELSGDRAEEEGVPAVNLTHFPAPFKAHQTQRPINSFPRSHSLILLTNVFGCLSPYAILFLYIFEKPGSLNY